MSQFELLQARRGRDMIPFVLVHACTSTKTGMRNVQPPRAPTLRDIADHLGISRGTVDRALHNRKGVSASTKQTILRGVRDLGYSPNRLAQFLVTGKTLRIAMITPGDQLWKSVREGANAFRAGMGHQFVNISWHETGVHDPVREMEIMRAVVDGGVDGIGIAPADPQMLTTMIDKAVRRGIAVVTLNTDAPQSRRLCFVGQDLALAGRLGAELMGKFLMGAGKVVVITAFRSVLAHRYRLDSFVTLMKERYPEIVVDAVYENHDNEEEAYRQIRGHLSRSPELHGVYLTTGIGPAGVTRALAEAGMDGRVRIVCFDFFPDTVQLVKRELVHATIGQDPFSQGYQTVKILYDYVIDRKKPHDSVVYTKIDIGLRENIDLLLGESRNSERNPPEGR